MFDPVSTLTYRRLTPTAQALVVTCPIRNKLDDVCARWNQRACAVIHDSSTVVRDVVRDLLANPQVRIIVFDGPACGRAARDEFWNSSSFPNWKIDHEHLGLVRQFVDLYDDDFGVKGSMQPFWPVRIRYLE